MNKLVPALAVLSFPLHGASPFTWNELPGGRMQLLENGKPALTYNFGPQLKSGAPEDRRRCCYIFPVFTPAGVSPLNDFPKDHWHHHGLFWAWPVVRTGEAKLDLWMYKGAAHRFEKWLDKRAGAREARLAVENGWYAVERKIVREIVKLAVFPTQSAAREMELSLTWEAVSERVTIEGSEEQGKSYGGLGARFAPRSATVIRTDSGPVATDEALVPHAWSELTGQYEGRSGTLRITPDPANPGGANQWCLRAYGFVGASWPGRSGAVQSFTLQPGAPLTLKFRIRVAD